MKLDAEKLQAVLKEGGNFQATIDDLQLPKLLGLKNLEVIKTAEQLKAYLELAKSTFESALEFPSFYINEDKKKNFTDKTQKYINSFIEESVDESVFYETVDELKDTRNK